MKKMLIYVLGAALLLSAACSHAPQDVTSVLGGRAVSVEQASADPLEDAETSTDAGIATGDGGFTELEYQFIGNLADLGIVSDIVGYDKMIYFAEEVFHLDGVTDKKVPVLYGAIQYFNIPEEAFRKQNDYWTEFNEEHGTIQTTYTEEQISALYCGDEEEMARRLMSPYAFRAGGEVLTVYDVLETTADDLVGKDVDLDELSLYCDRMREEVKNHSDVGHEWFEEKFDAMEGTIEEARRRKAK